MAYVIKLEHKEDLEWLETILGNSVNKLKSGNSERLESVSINIARVHEAVVAATEVRERKQSDTEPKISAKDDYVYNLCADHPKSAFQRPPRTGCEGCWAAYKKLHPESYDINRRKFDARQRDVESS